MTDRKSNGVALYFGTQVRKERLKAHLTITALANITEMDDGHLGRIERGIRPPTAEIATKMDEAFPKREGWFTEFYLESRSWVPAQFRVWSEHEDPAQHLWIWSPTVVDGLLQTVSYARGVLEAVADVTPDAVAARLKSRLDRQKRVLFRPDPPKCVFVVDLLSLFREIGSPEIMAEQCAHLLELADLPNITVQIFPAIVPPAVESGFILTGDAGYAEHVVLGGVYGDHAAERMRATFDALRAECLSARESRQIIKTLEDMWRRGVSPATAAVTAASALK